MTPQEKLIATAVAEVGYKEGSNNWNKFAEALDLDEGFYNGPKQNQAWCDVFVDWCMVEAFGTTLGRTMIYQPLLSCGAACQYSMQYYKTAGSFFRSDPAPGDQVFFGTGQASHTGIVETVTDSQITTIEGNSSDSVKRNTYKRSSSYILGYGRPAWGLAENDADIPEDPSADNAPEPDLAAVGVRVLTKGDRGNDVAALQAVLRQRGFTAKNSVKRDGRMDGEFGTGTHAQLCAFQTAVGLEPTGICDIKTWEALMHE